MLLPRFYQRILAGRSRYLILLYFWFSEDDDDYARLMVNISREVVYISCQM